MAVKYRQEFYSVNDSRYRINIDDDTLGTAANLAFDVDSNLFSLTYEGQNDDRFQSVIPSKCRIGVIVNSTDLEDLIADMVNSVDGRFKILIERYNKGTLAFEKFWFGNVITDQISYEDKSYPFIFNITAIDQLGTLAEIDYNDDGTTYTGKQTIIEHLINIFDKTDQNYFHNATDIFLSTVCSWYDDNHVYNLGQNDPLILSRIDHVAFFREDDDSNISYFNCLTVLKELARVFGARIYQSGGSIRFEQVNEREGADYYAFEYDKTGVQQSEGLKSFDTVTTDKTISKTHLAGGQFSFLPGLKYVKLDYNHESNRNLIGGQIWSTDENNNLVIGSIQSNQTTDTFRLVTSIYVKIVFVTSSTDLWRFTFKLKIKHGTKWLKRDITDSGDGVLLTTPATWEDTESYYVISTDWLITQAIILSIPINIETPIIPLALGDLEFDFNTAEIYKREATLTGTSGTPYVGPPVSDINIDFWELQDHSLEFLSEGKTNTKRTRTYQVNNDFFVGNTQTKEISTFIGDAITYVTRGKIEIYNGTTWQDSTAWSVNQTGTTYSIMELMIYEILSGQKRGTQKYNGSFQIIGFNFFERIVYASVNYLMMSGTFNAHQDTWSGSFFNLVVSRNNMTFGSEVNSGSSTGSLPSGGSTSSGGSSTVSFTPPVPEFFDNVVGATITGLTGTLPPNSLATQYLEVYRDGRKLRHTTDYTIDEGNNEIDLVLQAMGEGFEIKIY